MCGISFYCYKEKHLKKELDNSLNVAAHRGPDARGIVRMNVGDFNVGVGHNRLSIIDVSESGAQPMVGAGVVLSYNGEIYNHKVLRLKLEEKGYVFDGSSDTEVILKLYQCYGVASFAMLKGMFAFVIIDKNTEKFYLVRDMVGIKPLYFYQKLGAFFAASEIKSLREFKEIDFAVDSNDIYEFFNNGFLYEPSTGFKYIKKLMPGHYFEFDLATEKKNINAFNTFDLLASNEPISKKIECAVDLQRHSDVPLGVFFSGGVDSSLIAKYAEKEELFFAKYDSSPASNLDLKYSKLISDYLGRHLSVSEFSSESDDVESLLESIDFVAKNTEELISDYTFWATYRLSKTARENGYKVMLSGMGGDEVFAGYPRYLILKSHRIIRFLSPLLVSLLSLNLFPKSLNKKFERLVSYSTEKDWGVAYSRMLGYFGRTELLSLFKNNDLENVFRERINSLVASYSGNKSDKVKLAQHLDLTGFLSHNLMVSDKASMLASIELRVPLLDETLVAHGLRLSSKELIKKNQTKYPLKNLLSTAFPAELFKRPKTGFNPPLDGLITKIGKDRLSVELSSLGGFLDFDFITILIDKHFSGVANNTYKLWQLLYFSRWLKYHAGEVY